MLNSSFSNFHSLTHSLHYQPSMKAISALSTALLALLLASVADGSRTLRRTSVTPSLRSRPTMRPAKPTDPRRRLADAAPTIGILWLPSDIRTGKAAPMVSTETLHDAAPQPVGLTWMPSDLRAGKVSLVPAFVPPPHTPTASIIGSPVGIQWSPSDLRVGNASLLSPLLPHATSSSTTRRTTH